MSAQGVATWWYPMGSPEGTRQSLGLDDTTDERALVVKWRTTALRGSRALLVGNLASTIGRQQIVGVTGDTLVILESNGAVRARRDYRSYFPSGYEVILGGLLDPGNAGLFTAGKPRYIAVGIERRSEGPGDSLWAFLADTTGTPVKQIKVAPPQALAPDNRLTALVPIAAYQPIASEPVLLATLSQNRFSPNGEDKLANALVRFQIGSHGLFEVGRKTEEYQIAPRPHRFHPSLIFDPATLLHYVILSTQTYSFAPPVTATPTATPPVNGRPTTSDRIYSIDLADDAGRFRNVETMAFPPEPAPAVAGGGGSYAATLYNSPVAGGAYFRIVTRDHSPGAPGQPSIALTDAFAATTTDYGSYTDPAVRDVGWRIVTANLDGELTNSGLPERQQYPNNAGDEIIAARQSDDDASIADNHLEVFRWNERDGNILTRFASQAFNGRLMASGDLVRDIFDRQEVVVAAGDSISILQLLPYKDPNFGALNRNFFRVVHVARLDGPVVSVAIADIEGDGGNDLIVVTTESTWAIGLRTPAPFGPPTPSATEVCSGDSITLRWNRRVGGGELGVDVSLLGPAGESLAAAGRVSSAGPDSLTIATEGLVAGSYRIRCVDRAIAQVADTSGPFTVVARRLHGLRLDAADIRFGDRLTATGSQRCVDSVRIETSLGDAPWSTPNGSVVEQQDTNVTARFDVICASDLRCGAADTVQLRLRLVSSDGRVVSDTLTRMLPLPRRDVRLEPGDTSRSRDRIVHFNTADFPCRSINVEISEDGSIWRRLPGANRDSGQYGLSIPEEFSGEIRLRLCCAEGVEASCEYALTRLEVSRLAEGDYVSPNPFDPSGGELSGGGARLVYTLKHGGEVTVSIFDASRTLTRRLEEGREQNPGRHIVRWDGRNQEGGIVANGAYICLIESSLGDRIVLPLYVIKRR